MTLHSMTGFARETGGSGGLTWSWEAKSVNGRGLDIRVRTPPGYDELADPARRALAGVLARGQVQVGLTLGGGAGPARVRINRDLLASLVATLATVARPADVGPATLDGLLAVKGVVETDDDTGVGADNLKAEAAAALPRLAATLAKARRDEGAALAAVLDRQIDAMTALVEAAEACPARHPDAIRRRLTEQVEQLLGTAASLDPARLHAEAAMLATRADIREELDRLAAHLASARDLLAAGGAVGRRLDFLAQELGREANTLCAKANDLSLTRTGLDLKAVVEQFREQVQNVE